MPLRKLAARSAQAGPSALSAVQPARPVWAMPLAQHSPSLQFTCCTLGEQARSATQLVLLFVSVPARPAVQLAPAAASAGMPRAYAACKAGHRQQRSGTTHSHHTAGQTARKAIVRGRATSPHCTAASRSSRLTVQRCTTSSSCCSTAAAHQPCRNSSNPQAAMLCSRCSSAHTAKAFSDLHSATQQCAAIH